MLSVLLVISRETDFGLHGATLYRLLLPVHDQAKEIYLIDHLHWCVQRRVLDCHCSFCWNPLCRGLLFLQMFPGWAQYVLVLKYSFTTSMLSAIVRLLVSGSRVMRLNIWRAKSVSAEFSVFKLQVQCFRFDLHRLLCIDWTKHLAQAQDELDKDASVRDLPHRSRLVLELQCWTC